jgi:hypothetical protein
MSEMMVIASLRVAKKNEIDIDRWGRTMGKNNRDRE